MADFQEIEVARWPRKDGALVLRRVTNKNWMGWDLRIWIATERYTGWSKKGIALSDEEWEQVASAVADRAAIVRSVIDGQEELA